MLKPRMALMSLTVISAVLIGMGFMINDSDETLSNRIGEPIVHVHASPGTDIQLIVREITPNGIIFVLDNQSDRRYIYGYPFNLYVRRDESWALLISMTGRLIGRDLAPMSTTSSIKRNWEGAVGSLEPGEYKFRKTLVHDSWQAVEHRTYLLDVIFILP